MTNKKLCEALKIPPVLNFGPCLAIGRLEIVATELAKTLGIDIPQLPLVLSAPQWLEEQALADGAFGLALGLPLHLAIPPFITGSAEEVMLKEDDSVVGVRLSDGRLIDCEMIVVATGVRPNVDFIEENTVKLDRGIVINNKSETSIKDIYAAGDVTGKSPIWPLAVKQGIIAAYNMVGIEKKLEDFFKLRNSMNFLGLQTVSLGLIEPPDESYSVSLEIYDDTYKQIIHRDGIIYGAIIQGDISYCGVLSQLIKDKINISHIDKDIFDIDYSDFFSIKENGEYEYVKKEAINI